MAASTEWTLLPNGLRESKPKDIPGSNPIVEEHYLPQRFTRESMLFFYIWATRELLIIPIISNSHLAQSAACGSQLSPMCHLYASSALAEPHAHKTSLTYLQVGQRASLGRALHMVPLLELQPGWIGPTD